MLQDEYYVAESASDDRYPVLSWDQPSGDFEMGRPVEFESPVLLRVTGAISDAAWADYHEFSSPVVSDRIADTLRALDVYGIQLVPVRVRNPGGAPEEIGGYWLVHVWNRIACLDMEKSALEFYEDGSIFGIDKLVLNETCLGRVALKNRLIFELSEKTSVLLVHETIKGAMTAANPVGCRFFRLADWYSDILFDQPGR